MNLGTRPSSSLPPPEAGCPLVDVSVSGLASSGDPGVTSGDVAIDDGGVAIGMLVYSLSRVTRLAGWLAGCIQSKNNNNVVIPGTGFAITASHEMPREDGPVQERDGGIQTHMVSF